MFRPNIVQVRGLGSKSLFGSMFKSKAEMAARATAQASKTAALKAALEALHAQHGHSPRSRSRSTSFDSATSNNKVDDCGGSQEGLAAAVDKATTQASSSLSPFQVEALQELFLVGGPVVPKSTSMLGSSSAGTGSSHTEASLRLGMKEFSVLAKALTKKVAMAALASGTSSGSGGSSSGYGSISQGLIVSPKDKDIAGWFTCADVSKRGSLNREDWVKFGQHCAQELKRPTTTTTTAAATATAGSSSLRSAAAWLLGSLPPDPLSNDPMEAAAALADAALTPPAAHATNGAFSGAYGGSNGSGSVSSSPGAILDWGDGGLLPGRAATFRYLDPLQRRIVLKALTYHSAVGRAQRVACLPYMRDRANVLGGLPTAEAAAVSCSLAITSRSYRCAIPFLSPCSLYA